MTLMQPLLSKYNLNTDSDQNNGFTKSSAVASPPHGCQNVIENLSKELVEMSVVLILWSAWNPFSSSKWKKMKKKKRSGGGKPLRVAELKRSTFGTTKLEILRVTSTPNQEGKGHGDGIAQREGMQTRATSCFARSGSAKLDKNKHRGLQHAVLEVMGGGWLGSAAAAKRERIKATEEQTESVKRENAMAACRAGLGGARVPTFLARRWLLQARRRLGGGGDVERGR